jgi:hypothetical protein
MAKAHTMSKVFLNLTYSQGLNTYTFDNLVNFRFEKYSATQDSNFRDCKLETSFWKERNTDYLLSFYWRPNNASSAQSFIYWPSAW